MKYILMADFGQMKQGTILDDRDRIEFILIADDKVFRANPSYFQPLPEMDEVSSDK